MKIKLVLLFVMVLVFSCKNDPQTGPVEIYYGENVCERCKMIISEKDFAAQYQLSAGEAVNFDDLGCMFHYMAEVHKDGISAIYVMDYGSKTWIDGKNAHYVWVQSIATPMGHGVIALGNEGEAREFADKENGKYLGGLSEATKWVMKK